MGMELRTRERERKLLSKIDKALKKLDEHDYGYCESCGVEIGIGRLEARPTATFVSTARPSRKPSNVSRADPPHLSNAVTRYTAGACPSPTGPLHFGSLVAAVASHADARHQNGEWLIRIEDVDETRTRAGSEQSILSTCGRSACLPIRNRCARANAGTSTRRPLTD